MPQTLDEKTYLIRYYTHALWSVESFNSPTVSTFYYGSHIEFSKKRD